MGLKKLVKSFMPLQRTIANTPEALGNRTIDTPQYGPQSQVSSLETSITAGPGIDGNASNGCRHYAKILLRRSSRTPKWRRMRAHVQRTSHRCNTSGSMRTSVARQTLPVKRTTSACNKPCMNVAPQAAAHRPNGSGCR